ncbi:Transcription factor, MADS-box [Corchorus capsularis]|uniref:Transcription factor, MADS-box n=1 Tax=Corchorus capsularis TaxID=210143 RepID=A0A1R3HFQ2_COCAP|nr:Transcription factor, MADS-box [Corchorus capsularis]
MTRQKVKLEWIESESARKASLKKRRLGLMKKVSELTTLCGVNAAVIVYSPDEVNPMVWPSPSMVHQQLARFQGMPNSNRLKRMNNQKTYLKEKISKAVEQLTKKQRRNKEAEMSHLMHQIFNEGKKLDELDRTEMEGLAWFAKEKMKEIRKRIEILQRNPSLGSVPNRQIPLPPQGVAANKTTQLGGGGIGNGTLIDPTDPNGCLMGNQGFMLNNNEPKSAFSSSLVRTEMGLTYYYYYPPFAANAINGHMGLVPRHLFGVSSSVAVDMVVGLSSNGNFRGDAAAPTVMGRPPLFIRPHAGLIDHMRLPLSGTSVGSSNFGSFGSDMGLGRNLFVGHIGSSSVGTDQNGLPPAPPSTIGTSRINGTDGVGLPFDGKTWPSNFFP